MEELFDSYLIAGILMFISSFVSFINIEASDRYILVGPILSMISGFLCIILYVRSMDREKYRDLDN